MREYWLTAANLGEILGCSYRTVENWAANNKIKQNSRGQYGVISAFEYKIEQLEDKIAQKDEFIAQINEDSPNRKKAVLCNLKLEAEIETQKAIAEIKKLELAKLNESMVDAEEVLLAWQNLIASCKAKFLALPAKLALELSGLDNPEEIQSRLTSVIYEALTELSSG